MYSLYEVPVSALKDIPVVQRVHTLVSESCSDLWANYTSTNVQIYLCHCRQRGQGLLMSKTEIKKQTRTREKETWPNKKLRLSQITTPAMSLLPWQSAWPWVSHMAFFIAVRPQLDPGLTAATPSGGRLDQSSHLKKVKEGRNQKLMRRLPGHIQRRQGVELRPHRHMAGWSAPEAEPKEGRGYRVGENREEKDAGEQSRCRVPVRQKSRESGTQSWEPPPAQKCSCVSTCVSGPTNTMKPFFPRCSDWPSVSVLHNWTFIRTSTSDLGQG